MGSTQQRIILARLMILGGLASGVVGLVIGVIDRTWKLGVIGWFTGGTLLTVLAMAILVDAYFAQRRESS